MSNGQAPLYPFGEPFALDEGHLITWIAQRNSTPDSQLAKTHDAKQREERLKQKADAALQEYLPQWNAWAEGERPRRKSISLYGDLFALRHQIEAEETAKPQELVRGVGIASWQIPFEESIVRFEYPLLTQAVEISIDEKSIALDVRPRSTDTRVEMDAFAACSLPASTDVERTPPSDKSVEFETIRFHGLSSRGSSHGKADELYFPLPYNEEQVTIIQRLEKAAGVAVQGPPGTGKTHTIANVICHYLATGRRVLVTSRGEPALQVLQSKIPEEVRALTVVLMASDREGVRQFQASIETIQHRVSQLNPEQTLHDIATLESAIDRAHHELASIDKRIDEIAIAQLSEIEVDGVPMRAQKLAELVTSGLEQHGWFDDEITLSPENAPPLTEEEAGKLREARRKVGQDLVYVQANYPSADSLPATVAIAELHETLSSIRRIEA